MNNDCELSSSFFEKEKNNVEYEKYSKWINSNYKKRVKLSEYDENDRIYARVCWDVLMDTFGDR